MGHYSTVLVYITTISTPPHTSTHYLWGQSESIPTQAPPLQWIPAALPWSGNQRLLIWPSWAAWLHDATVFNFGEVEMVTRNTKHVTSILIVYIMRIKVGHYSTVLVVHYHNSTPLTSPKSLYSHYLWGQSEVSSSNSRWPPLQNICWFTSGDQTMGAGLHFRRGGACVGMLSLCPHR